MILTDDNEFVEDEKLLESGVRFAVIEFNKAEPSAFFPYSLCIYFFVSGAGIY